MPFLSRALSINPRGLAFDDGEDACSYEELARTSGEMAARLRTLGVGPGHVVALAGKLDGTVLAALHGIFKAGGAAAPFNERWTRREWAEAREVLNPKLFLVGGSFPGLPEAAPGPPNPRVFALGSPGDSAFPPLCEVDPSTAPLPREAPETECARLLTSGTSGRPRIVRISFQNLWASGDGSRERLDLVPSDRWLGSLSLSHIGGLALVTRAAMAGSGLVLRGSFNAHTFLTLMEEGNITHASLVPTMLHQALEAWGGRTVPSSLRCLLIGGASAREELVRSALDAGFPISLTYGLTEASSQVATAPPALARAKPGTVGPPLPGVTVRVSDGGELLVRGPTVAPGQARSDGWLHTGDLAREDGDGHIWITGRMSDRIISGGVNVDPVEVEQALESHSRVREAVVIGIPDREWGERVVALVVSEDPGPALEEALEELVRKTFSPAKRPRAFRFLEAVPRNPNGKVDREKVRALFR